MDSSVSIFQNVITRLTFAQRILQIPMNFLVNSSKNFEKYYINFTQTYPENKIGKNTFQLILSEQHYSDTKTRQRH